MNVADYLMLLPVNAITACVQWQMTIASLWKTSSINPSQRWQNHQVSALLGLVGHSKVHWSTVQVRAG